MTKWQFGVFANCHFLYSGSSVLCELNIRNLFHHAWLIILVGLLSMQVQERL